VANETHAATAPTALAASPSDTTSEEQALVERAQHGDTAALRALYLRHADAVFRCAILPLIRDRNLAEDLLADTFVRAIENLHRFRWQGKGLLPWLIRIGKNLCLDHLRKSGRTTAWPEGLEQQLPDTSEADAEQLLGRSQLSDILQARIAACLDELNPRYRRVLELRLIDKRSREDAAAQLDVTIGTLDVLLFRACKAFRKIWARRYESEPAPDPDPSRRP
jgi:RNA polymerase sigma-70 factor (ECF subfamily)